MEPASSLSPINNDYLSLTLLEVKKNGQIKATKTQDINNLPLIINTSKNSSNAIECAIKILTNTFNKKEEPYNKEIRKTAKKIIDYYLQQKIDDLEKNSKKKISKKEAKESIVKDLSLIANFYTKEMEEFKIKIQKYQLEKFFKNPATSLNVVALEDIFNDPSSKDPTNIHSSNGQDIVRHLASGIVSLKNSSDNQETIYGNTSNLQGSQVNEADKKRVVLLRLEKLLLQFESVINKGKKTRELIEEIKKFTSILALDETIDLDTLSDPLESQMQLWRKSDDPAKQKLALLLLTLNQSFYVRPSGFISQMINVQMEKWPNKILKLYDTKFIVDGEKKIDYEIFDDKIEVKMHCRLIQVSTPNGKEIQKNSKEAVTLDIITTLSTRAPEIDNWEILIDTATFTNNGDENLAEKIHVLLESMNSEKIKSHFQKTIN